MRNSNRNALARWAFAGALALAPALAPASVIIVSNGSSVSADTLAEVGYPAPPASDSDTQSVTFPAATSVPGSFGDDLVAHAEAAGYGPPDLWARADASASLQVSITDVAGVVTVTADGSAFAMVQSNGGAAEAESSAILSLVLQLDAPYTYEFSTGPLNVGYNQGATLVGASLRDLGSDTNVFWSDTIATGCDFGCASLAPVEGSFTGLLAPGSYRLYVSAQTARLQQFQTDEAIAAFADAQFTLTAVPLPAAIWLFGGALGVLGLVKRRQTTT